MVVFLMPVVFDRNDSINWQRVWLEWIRVIPFLLIFLIHNYLLFPIFFQRKRFWYYLISTVAAILLIAYLNSAFGQFLHELIAPRGEMNPRGISGMNQGMPPSATGMYTRRVIPPRHLMILDDLLICTLVVGFNLAIKLAITRQFEEQKLKDLQKEKLETELAFLRNQLSPHFFMNTLNNIHALIDINSGDAKDSIIRLSKLMRYLLYESDEEKTSLKKEIEFIRSYVDLMKLRYTEQVKIELSFPENVPDVKIPPMLFTSLLENSFKHGVSYQKDSFVGVEINIENELLKFGIRNSQNQTENPKDEHGGIGLENLQKRLDLIYGTNYSLKKTETGHIFEIIIKIPVNG